MTEFKDLTQNMTKDVNTKMLYCVLFHSIIFIFKPLK